MRLERTKDARPDRVAYLPRDVVCFMKIRIGDNGSILRAVADEPA